MTTIQTPTRWIMGRDQHGETYHDLGEHPRAELLKRLDRKSASKMYVDGKNGTRHVGYVIGEQWVTLHVVTPWEGTA